MPKGCFSPFLPLRKKTWMLQMPALIHQIPDPGAGWPRQILLQPHRSPPCLAVKFRKGLQKCPFHAFDPFFFIQFGKREIHHHFLPAQPVQLLGTVATVQIIPVKISSTGIFNYFFTLSSSFTVLSPIASDKVRISLTILFRSTLLMLSHTSKCSWIIPFCFM